MPLRTDRDGRDSDASAHLLKAMLFPVKGRCAHCCGPLLHRRRAHLPTHAPFLDGNQSTVASFGHTGQSGRAVLRHHRGVNRHPAAAPTSTPRITASSSTTRMIVTAMSPREDQQSAQGRFLLTRRVATRSFSKSSAATCADHLGLVVRLEPGRQQARPPWDDVGKRGS
jgi:hypothetical protein